MSSAELALDTEKVSNALPGRKRKVFDCFTFFNELDILEIRLKELSDEVDFFVIVEANKTFQGNPKALNYWENRERFAQFHDQIIYIPIDDLPESQNPWDLEHFQRQAIRRAFGMMTDNDIIIISDADEIVTPKSVSTMRQVSGPTYFQLRMPMYYYYFNLRESENNWNKTFAFTFDLVNEIIDFNSIRTDPDGVFKYFDGRNLLINSSGWHFTYLGGRDRILAKLNAFSHNEGWSLEMLPPGKIERQTTIGFNAGQDWHLAEYVPIDESYPKIIQGNVVHYTKSGYIKDIYIAARELQLLCRDFYTEQKMQSQS